MIISAATMLGRLAGSSATKPSPPACERQVTPSASRARWQQVQGGRGRMRRRQGGGTAYPVSACERGMCTHLRACPQKHASFSRDDPRLHEPSVGSRPTAGYNTSIIKRTDIQFTIALSRHIMHTAFIKQWAPRCLVYIRSTSARQHAQGANARAIAPRVHRRPAPRPLHPLMDLRHRRKKLGV